MASHTLSPSVWISFRNRVVHMTESATRLSMAKHSPEGLQAERDLVKEAILKNPEAFSSDADVQLMMHMYSGR